MFHQAIEETQVRVPSMMVSPGDNDFLTHAPQTYLSLGYRRDYV